MRKPGIVLTAFSAGLVAARLTDLVKGEPVNEIALVLYFVAMLCGAIATLTGRKRAIRE